MMKAPRVVLHPAVPDDLRSIIDYLAERSPDAAARFARAIRKTVVDVARFPGAGSPKQFNDAKLAGVRSWRVRSFKKYLIFYWPIEDGIRVLAVLHGARDVPSALGDRT
jgi:toxin ParE1/3/4